MFNIGMMISLEEHIVTFLAHFKEINAYGKKFKLYRPTWY
jgi:hypothetical protein